MDYYEFDGKLTYEKFVNLRDPSYYIDPPIIAYLDLYSDSSYDTIDKDEFPRIREILKSEKFSSFEIKLRFYEKSFKEPYFDYQCNSW